MRTAAVENSTLTDQYESFINNRFTVPL